MGAVSQDRRFGAGSIFHTETSLRLKKTALTKEQKIQAFDPNGVASSDSLFGLPFTYKESETIILPVPWEVTVSYTPGTANAPAAIKKASSQVDLYDPLLPDAWKRGIFMLPIDGELWKRSTRNRKAAEQHIQALEAGRHESSLLEQINSSCEYMANWVQERCGELLDDKKRLVLLGGDHSTPLGFIRALAQRHESFGILQIDAHADLRKAYEDFEYSHASIMYNALKVEQISRLVQVGIRDYCEAEVKRIEADDRISCFYDRDLKQGRYRGKSWEQQCDEVIAQLPEKVYLSFDIDGLDPKLCPNTGTPVAGGFEVEEVLFLVERLVQSGKQIIGVDLNEVSPSEDEWDANVGARLLYRLCNLMALSHS